MKLGTDLKAGYLVKGTLEITIHTLLLRHVQIKLSFMCPCNVCGAFFFLPYLQFI